MAQFNADILLSVQKSSQLTNAIKKLEQDIDRVAKKAGDIGKFVGKNAEARAAQEALKIRAESLGVVKATTRELERQAKIVDTIANVRSARIARERNEILQQQQRGAGQYATSIGPQPDRTKRLRRAEVFDRTAAARAEGIARQTQFIKLQQVENRVKLEAARDTAQATGELKAFEREAERLTTTTKQAKNSLKDLNNAQQKSTSKQGGRNRLGSALVGGAFPALFGGGPGAIVGGFAGELFGPLGGVVGSAIGSQFDKIGASAAELGQALGALEPDINRLIEGLGLAGTSTGQLIKGIEEAEGAQVAQAIAAERMATFVGVDGVNALRDAGDAASELGREASQAFTALAVALAPALEAVADFLATNIQEQRQLSRVDPGVFGVGAGDLAGREDVQQVRQDFASRVIDETEARARLLAIVKEIEAVEQQIFDTRLQSNRTLTESYDQVRQQFELSQAELEVARLGGDLKNENVFKAEEQNIKLQFAIRYQELLNEAVKTEADRRIINLKLLALENQELAALANLDNRRNKALTGGSGGGKSAPQSQAASLQQQILRDELKRNDVRLKALDLLKGEEAALKVQQSQLAARLQKETEIIELQRQQALERNKIPGEAALINQLYDSRVKTQTEELQLQFAQNQERLRAIALERELADEKATQEREGISTDLTRQIEDAQFSIANPFDGFEAEQAELAISQLRRYEDALKDIENQETIQKKVIQSGALGDDLINANAELDRLAEKKKLYQELLPVLDQVEQQELKMQQTMQMLQPITDGLAAGITDFFTAVIDGSKSAEEAFADMLKGMGQALIQQGAIMIAQYIAIGIARLFAGMGGGTPSGGFGTGSQAPLTNGLDFTSAFMGRSTGGPVGANRPYMVGENGPELFLPSTSGTVVNNGDTRSALGRYNSGNNDMVVNYSPNIQSTTINGQEYVTVEQMNQAVNQGMTMAAKKGAQGGFVRTMSSLKNNRSNRKTIGL